MQIRFNAIKDVKYVRLNSACHPGKGYKCEGGFGSDVMELSQKS